MELQELVTIWHSSDQELDEKLKINHSLFKEVSVNKIRSLLGEVKWTHIIEIVINYVFLVFLIGFFVDYFSVWKYAIPAGILILIITYSIGFNIHMLRLFYRIDVKSTILQTQKTVESLKYYQLLDRKMLYVIIPIFSTPFLIVMAEFFFGFDLYMLGTWLIAYAAGSLIVAVIVVYIFSKFPDKNMEKAISFIREIKDFEKEI